MTQQTELVEQTKEQRRQQAAHVKLMQHVRIGAGLDVDEWPDEALDAVRAQFMSVTTAANPLIWMMKLCKKHDLAPGMDGIWLVDMPQQGVVPVIGRAAYMKVAKRQPGYVGFRTGVVYDGDVFTWEDSGDTIEAVLRSDGFPPAGKPPIGAYCIAKSEGRPDVGIRVRWSDYSHLMNKDNWKKYGPTMIGTRAIVDAFRLQYGLDDLHTPDEFAEAGSPAALAPGRAIDGSPQQGTGPALKSLREGLADMERSIVKPSRIPGGKLLRDLLPPDLEVLEQADVEDVRGKLAVTIADLSAVLLEEIPHTVNGLYGDLYTATGYEPLTDIEVPTTADDIDAALVRPLLVMARQALEDAQPAPEVELDQVPVEAPDNGEEAAKPEPDEPTLPETHEKMGREDAREEFGDLLEQAGAREIAGDSFRIEGMKRLAKLLTDGPDVSGLAAADYVQGCHPDHIATILRDMRAAHPTSEKEPTKEEPMN